MGSDASRCKILLVLNHNSYGCGPFWRFARLSERRFDRTVLSIRDSGELLASISSSLGWRQGGGTLVGLDQRWMLFGTFAATIRLRRLRPTIVQTAHAPSFLLGLLAKIFLRAKWVHFEGTLNSRYRGPRRWLTLLPVLFADCVVCVSDAVKCSNEAADARYGVTRRTRTVIYNGVSVGDIDLFASSSKRGARPICIGYVGRLEPVKNLVWLIHEFDKLLRAGERAELRLIGAGSQYEELIELAGELGIAGAVQVVGEMSRDDVYRELWSLDIFVLPSFYEGLSSSLAQAMAAQCCVIVSDIPANRELVEKDSCGYVVPIKEGALCAALLDALRCSEKRQKFGFRARHRVIERLDVRGVLAEYETLYRNLIGYER